MWVFAAREFEIGCPAALRRRQVALVRTQMSNAIEHQIPSTLNGTLPKLFKVKPFENQPWSLTSC
jgi:hypothetical protein